MRPINQHWVNEIHANARFDIIKNKGFWLNGEQEIEDDDWHNPKQESFIYNPHQPNNPNYLAVVTGCSGCIMSGADEKVFIGKSVQKVDLLPQLIKIAGFLLREKLTGRISYVPKYLSYISLLSPTCLYLGFPRAEGAFPN